jgi:PTH1 family peptidyl-tRNA hydrolase
MPALRLITGLGNPGQQYADTRHNAGLWFLEALADQLGATFTKQAKFKARIAKAQIGDQELVLLWPEVFMNVSGQSVAAYAQFFNVPANQILIAHDELDFVPGRTQFKSGGGHGGHNGLRDIAPQTGSDFHRLRIGIGHPGHKSQVSAHVLSKPSAIDRALIERTIETVLKHTAEIAQGHFDPAKQALGNLKSD